MQKGVWQVRMLTMFNKYSEKLVIYIFLSFFEGIDCSVLNLYLK